MKNVGFVSICRRLLFALKPVSELLSDIFHGFNITHIVCNIRPVIPNMKEAVEFAQVEKNPRLIKCHIQKL